MVPAPVRTQPQPITHSIRIASITVEICRHSNLPETDMFILYTITSASPPPPPNATTLLLLLLLLPLLLLLLLLLLPGVRSQLSPGSRGGTGSNGRFFVLVWLQFRCPSRTAFRLAFVQLKTKVDGVGFCLDALQWLIKEYRRSTFFGVPGSESICETCSRTSKASPSRHR